MPGTQIASQVLRTTFLEIRAIHILRLRIIFAPAEIGPYSYDFFIGPTGTLESRL
jgi:hypothetical protein